jgi:hypothetical protein
MEHKVTEKRKERSGMKKDRLRRGTWWVSGLILLAITAGGGYLYWHKTAEDQQVDPARLAGRWLRPDGGYVLELSDIRPKGLVKAAYFNPRPINVSGAEWQRQEGRLGLFVELRDVNYPGSTYTLVYEGEKDRLVGIYYQALLRQRFNVEFVRVK